jgi:short-subunit dehydrogenase
MVLITGATSGIGYELAKIFSKKGYNLLLIARDKKTLEKTAHEISSQYGNKIFYIASDLSKPNSPEMIYQEVKSKGITVDILVNNAGFGIYGDFATVDLERHMDLIQVNVLALISLTRLFLPEMLKKKQGKILNTASTAAFQPGPHMAIYYASKAFVLSFSEALASELEGSGVSVTALCPGPTKTGFEKGSQINKSKLFTLVRPMNAEIVAQIGYNALMKGRPVVIAGWKNALLAYSGRFLPQSLVTRISKYTLE